METIIPYVARVPFPKESLFREPELFSIIKYVWYYQRLLAELGGAPGRASGKSMEKVVAEVSCPGVQSQCQSLPSPS